MLLELLVSLVAVVFFALSLYLTKIVKVAQDISHQAYQGIGAMTDSQLSDDEKEIAVRKAGIVVFFGAWSIFWRFALCLFLTYIPIYLADIVSLASEESVLELMLRLDYIVIVSLVMIAIVWLFNKRSSKVEPTDNALSYNMGERTLHMIAFAGSGVQKLYAKIDDIFFSLFHRKIKDQSPIFITSLARGGTTAVLNALNDLPSVSTHTYRDMPFITAPYLWNKLNAPFKRKVVKRKRAHGDGLEIDLDSPEAFDEVYWRLYWPEKYQNNVIALWGKEDEMSEGVSRLRSCFKKVTYLRGQPESHYLSKNNANIARLRIIKDVFPGAQIVVPVRSPAAHAASLLRQHKNFLQQQADDDFVRRYMNDIGHLEFGLLHTPIAFDGFDRNELTPEFSDYWLVYWIAAFREVLANIENCHIVLQDELRENPNACMHRLLKGLQLDDNRDFANFFRNEPDLTDKSVFSPKLLAEAEALYEEIAKKAK